MNATTQSQFVAVADRSMLRLSDILHRSEQQILQIADDTSSHYRTISIPKSSGGERTIHCPSREIKELHRCLLAFLYKNKKVSKFAHGGVPGRSTQTCAEKHVGQKYVATLDIANFFPSVTHRHIFTIFSELGFAAPIVEVLTDLTTVDGRLPQGAPTSPMLANLALYGLDSIVIRYCKNRKLKYSRYLDDLVISGDSINTGIKGTIKSSLSHFDFELAESKFKFMGPDMAHDVLGFTVNNSLRPSKAYAERLESDIDLSIENGISIFAAKECLSFRKAKGRLNGQVSYLENHMAKQASRLRGKLNDVRWDG